MSDEGQVDSIYATHGPQGRQPRTALDLSDIEEYVNESPDALFNSAAYCHPGYEVKREQGHHRLWIMLKVQGWSNKEIAAKYGYDHIHIGTVLRQPWARARMMEEIKKLGGDEVRSIFQSKAADLAWDLIEIAENTSEKGSTRVAAINTVHDRLMGKPNQPMTHVNVDTSTMSDAEMFAFLQEAKKISQVKATN